MPIDPYKCCGEHTKEKEDYEECCQLKDQEKAEKIVEEICKKLLTNVVIENYKINSK